MRAKEEREVRKQQKEEARIEKERAKYLNQPNMCDYELIDFADAYAIVKYCINETDAVKLLSLLIDNYVHYVGVDREAFIKKIVEELSTEDAYSRYELLKERSVWALP